MVINKVVSDKVKRALIIVPGLRALFQHHGQKEQGNKETVQLWLEKVVFVKIRFSSTFQTSESVVLNYLYFLFMSGKSYSLLICTSPFCCKPCHSLGTLGAQTVI